MGNDMYQTPQEMAGDLARGVPPIGIGEGSIVEGAIIDKNCRIGRNVRVVNETKVENTPDEGPAQVRDGIMCVPKEATLPDNWRM
jgi:glucose-1-phosphate adenylyltransferase